MLVRKDIEVEYETLFDKHHYGATIYGPLAGGFLTGKHIDGILAGTRYMINYLDWTVIHLFILNSTKSFTMNLTTPQKQLQLLKSYK